MAKILYDNEMECCVQDFVSVVPWEFLGGRIAMELPCGFAEMEEERKASYYPYEKRPELILENLSVRNCAKVFCSPEQKSVLQLVCENVAKIIDTAKTDSEDGDEEADEDILGMLEEDENIKTVNADTYIL